MAVLENSEVARSANWGGGIMPTITYLAEQLGDAARSNIGLRTLDRMNDLIADARRDRIADAAAGAAVNEAIEDKHGRQRDFDRERRHYRGFHQELPADLTAAHEAKISAATADLESVHAESARASKK